MIITGLLSIRYDDEIDGFYFDLKFAEGQNAVNKDDRDQLLSASEKKRSDRESLVDCRCVRLITCWLKGLQDKSK